MQYLVFISILLLTTGLLLKEEYFTINIHDTYFVTSYLYIAVFFVVFLNLILFLNYLLKKNLRR